MNLDLNPELKKRLGLNYDKMQPSQKGEILSILSKFISLGFDASFSRYEEGPVVNTAYFRPAASSTLGRIFGKEEDIALGINCESVIIGREKGEIFIQVPKTPREIIHFDKYFLNFLQSAFITESVLPIFIGKNTKGEDIYVDIATFPHLLVGGSTNSGKSVFISQLICSLSLARSTKDLSFILVDTKQLDLVLFSGLPHITDVITDIHGLRNTLENLLDEVRTRVAKMSGFARNIKEYNGLKMDTPYNYKVLIIDEFADVIDTDRQYLASLKPAVRPVSIEELVKTLAQISRAAGIHLILATQRPSVKVISGDIKVNFPARIAFKLSSMMDSRVILDENGAEKLLGMGDFLYKLPGLDTIKRAHSAFVSMRDIATIIAQADVLREQYVKK